MNSNNITPGSQKVFAIAFQSGGNSGQMAEYILEGYGEEAFSKTVVVSVGTSTVTVTNVAMESERKVEITLSEERPPEAELWIRNVATEENNSFSLKPSEGAITIPTTLESREVRDSIARNLSQFCCAR